MERCNRGKSVNEYLSQLKLAVINQDLKKLEELADIEFKSENYDEIAEAHALIGEAIKILSEQKNKTFEAMQSLKKLRSYTDEYSNNKGYL